MAQPSKIQHPLLNRPGSSQRKRLADSFALKSEYAPIDSRSLADLLDYIYEYARQIVFYEQKRDELGEEYTELSNWLAFFENSLPFRMVRFSKTNFDQLEQDLLGVVKNLEQNPSPENLKILLDFTYYELLLPIDHLQKLTRQYEFDLVSYLEGAIRTILLPAVLRFIHLSNAAHKYFYVGKRNFTSLTQAPWSLLIEDIFSTDESITKIPGGNNGAILWMKEELNKLIYQLLGGLRAIAQAIPHHLETGLEVIKSRNEPHLGLLFAFIRLFRYFQGDLNQLTQQHLDFFYQHVLQIKPKGIVPDQAHLVFEIAKHLESYLIKKGTAFKDGKDANNADIIFQTDEEIVIDKAQIKDLKTLYLKQVNGKLEGVYIAPVANSADGKGEKFKDEQSKNWATLGSKPSKYIAPGMDTPENNPFGRIGFVLASPVLWLNEGKRKITITINCDNSENYSICSECFEKYVRDKNLFSLQFSGEEGWFSPKEQIIFDLTVSQSIALTFTAHLQPDEPKVAFYHPAAIKENFIVEHPFPMVKIELNPEIQLLCDNTVNVKDCCLENSNEPKEILTALYHYFRHLIIETVKIDVQVCGVKNLIVQNEESLQDMNSLILPFGSRPKIKSEFYVGSKEVFCKHWTCFDLIIDWKNRPENFKAHYEDYSEKLKLETEHLSTKITDALFKIEPGILENGIWKSYGQVGLFPDNKNIQTYQFNNCSDYSSKIINPVPLERFAVDTRDGFLKLVLRGASFQHSIYPFALADFLLQLAGKVSLLSVEELNNKIDDAKKRGSSVSTKILNLESQIKRLKNDLEAVISKIKPNESRLLRLINRAINDLDSALVALQPPPLGSITGALNAINSAKSKLNELSTEISNILTSYKDVLDASIVKIISPIQGGINGIKSDLGQLLTKLNEIKDLIKINGSLPKEPYTPTIKSISIDYTATADNEDIELIHLYPFANSSKTEYLALHPTLFPTFVDEGSLFIGLENLRPGANLHLLFQFAEATADSESKRAAINWHYLIGNQWQPLRTGFELLEDATERMTRSGIVKIAVPRDISNTGNTLMPPTADNKHLYWLKVSAPQSVAAVADVIGIHTQSTLATWHLLPNSEIARVGKALEPMRIAKPLLPDFSIKRSEQPYESFGGKLPEAQGHLYTRVSEHLRHKGRGVDTFDIEHLVLEAFPQLFKCKCISHTFGLSANQYLRDLEVAPGFITVAVIPDLTKLKAGDGLEPKVPLSTLTEIKEFLGRNTSPFAHIKVLNPRFEKIKVEVKVRLMAGRDENYYTAQLKTDLMRFLAPWYLGNSDKLSFGQAIVNSDVLGFIERLEYIDFITALKLIDTEGVERNEIVPLTARSILTGGEICIELDRRDCIQDTITTPGERINPNRFNRKPDPIDCGEAQAFLKYFPDTHTTTTD